MSQEFVKYLAIKDFWKLFKAPDPLRFLQKPFLRSFVSVYTYIFCSILLIELVTLKLHPNRSNVHSVVHSNFLKLDPRIHDLRQRLLGRISNTNNQ